MPLEHLSPELYVRVTYLGFFLIIILYTVLQIVQYHRLSRYQNKNQSKDHLRAEEK